MKRYFFGLIAILFATGMVAFTKPGLNKKTLATYTFYYIPPGGTDFSQSAVQNKANWISNPGTPPTCNGAAKACQMEVTDTYTELNGSDVRVFKTSGSVVNIVADEGNTANLYVPIVASSTGLQGKTDRPN